MVTGATSDLGYETALALAQGYADVIVAGRDEATGRSTASSIRSQAPNALVRFEKLDLADLASVEAFAGRLGADGRPLDLLVNNAGVMAPHERRMTADGFEMQLGTNYLGHFALTGRLLPLLRLSRFARVVQVSCLTHRLGKIRFDDLNGVRVHRPWRAYFQSKLAMVLFARELQRQSDAHGWRLLSSAVHPGYARTGIFSNGGRSAVSVLSGMLGRVLGQSAADGAQPALFAADSSSALEGGFYGPGGLLELAGPPAAAQISKRALDLDVARRLWQVSEQLTGVTWPTDR